MYLRKVRIIAKKVPFLSLVDNITISQGKYSSSTIFNIYPTLTVLQLITLIPVLVTPLHFLEFSSSSLFAL